MRTRGFDYEWQFALSYSHYHWTHWPITNYYDCGLHFTCIKLIGLDRYFPAMERRGLELGLLFLTIGVLVPFASERISMKDILSVFTTWQGIIALLGGAIATYMNGKGLELLKIDPQLIVGLVIGSIFGIIFMRGIPVGPLMAAGITAFLLKLAYFISDKIG